MKKPILTAAAVMAATPAMAHHPLGGLPMETLSHGLLSGIGHPVLGFDHLFFVAIFGIAALFTLYLTPTLYLLLARLSKARAAEADQLSEELRHAEGLAQQT